MIVTEVVLSMLLERMEFKLAEGKKIAWRNSGVTAPILKSEPEGAAQLPLLIRLLEGRR